MSNGNIQVDMTVEAQFEDLLSLNCTFDKLKVILRMLINSQKNHANHISELMNKCLQFDK